MKARCVKGTLPRFNGLWPERQSREVNGQAGYGRSVDVVRENEVDLKSALINRGTDHENIRWVETQNPRVWAKVDVGRLSPDLHALISAHLDAKPKSPLRRLVAGILAPIILEWDAREGNRDGDHAAPISPEFLAKVSKPFLKELYE